MLHVSMSRFCKRIGQLIAIMELQMLLTQIIRPPCTGERQGALDFRQPAPHPNLPPYRGKGLVEGSDELSGFNNPFERFER